ncbi:peptidoglycan-binding domain-containing protein [Nocardia sp. CA-135953]|uniref:peptidoglycan-binding domain-containing protein n=1 Tax=Nocardia sp. CA-135953 TaxID=3239978 RepID=UPI003D98E759
MCCLDHPNVVSVYNLTYSHGNGQVDVDGKFGPKTKAAERNFQRAVGIYDGVVSPATLRSLQNACTTRGSRWRGIATTDTRFRCRSDSFRLHAAQIATEVRHREPDGAALGRIDQSLLDQTVAGR